MSSYVISLSNYSISQDQVETLTGLDADELMVYFLSPNRTAATLKTIDGRFIKVKRPYHEDPEMRGIML